MTRCRESAGPFAGDARTQLARWTLGQRCRYSDCRRAPTVRNVAAMRLDRVRRMDRGSCDAWIYAMGARRASSIR
jgi:hypothetical protein